MPVHSIVGPPEKLRRRSAHCVCEVLNRDLARRYFNHACGFFLPSPHDLILHKFGVPGSPGCRNHRDGVARGAPCTVTPAGKASIRSGARRAASCGMAYLLAMRGATSRRRGVGPKSRAPRRLPLPHSQQMGRATPLSPRRAGPRPSLRVQRLLGASITCPEIHPTPCLLPTQAQTSYRSASPTRNHPNPDSSCRTSARCVWRPCLHASARVAAAL